MPGIGLSENGKKLREFKAMNEILTLTLSLISGIMLGFFYFGGLWLTLKRLHKSNQPALLTIGSLLGRSAVCLFGFYLISGSGLEVLFLSLAGFVLSKIALIHRFGFQAHKEAD